QDVRRGDGLRLAVLEVVEIDAVLLPLGDGTRSGKQIGFLPEDKVSNQFGTSSGFLVAVNWLDGNMELHAIAACGFWTTGQADLIEHAFHEESCIDDQIERALLRVEIDQNKIRVVERARTAHPRVVIDAAEVYEVEQAGVVVGEDVVD